MTHLGQVLNLKKFQGDVIVTNSVFDNNIVNFGSCEVSERINYLEGYPDSYSFIIRDRNAT